MLLNVRPPEGRPAERSGGGVGTSGHPIRPVSVRLGWAVLSAILGLSLLTTTLGTLQTTAAPPSSGCSRRLISLNSHCCFEAQPKSLRLAREILRSLAPSSVSASWGRLRVPRGRLSQAAQNDMGPGRVALAGPLGLSSGRRLPTAAAPILIDASGRRAGHGSFFYENSPALPRLGEVSLRAEPQDKADRSPHAATVRLRQPPRSPAAGLPPYAPDWASWSPITRTVALSTGVAPWPRALAVDEPMGLAYLAEGERGTVSVVAGTSLVDVIPVGQKVTDIAIDPGLGFAYASAADPYALYAGHIAVLHGVELITQVVVAGIPGPAAVDYQHNRAYVGVHTADPFSDQVFVFQRDDIIAIPNTSPGIVAIDVNPERERAYVLSEAGPSVTIINGTTVVDVVQPLTDLGVPRDLAVDPTSGLVYVVGQSPFRQVGTVLVISGTQQLGARLPVGTDPRSLAVDPQRGLVYVTNAGDDTVTVIAGTGVIGTIGVGPVPDAIAVDSRRDRVYVSNTGDGTTTVIAGQQVVTTLPAGGGPLIVDAERGIAYLSGNGLAVVQDDALLGHLPVAAMPARLAVNPESDLVYVCNQGTRTLNVLSDAQVTATLPLTDTPREIGVDPVSGWLYILQDMALTVMRDTEVSVSLPIVARDLALDPVRGLAYVAADGVAVMRGPQVLSTVDLGQPARGVAVNRVTGLVYATAGGAEDGFVAVISGTERIGTIDVGGAPGRLVVDPVQDRVFVLHPEQGRLSVIEGTRRRFPNIFLPRPALDAAVHPLTGDVYVATRGPLVLAQGLDGGVIDLGLEALSVAVDVKQGLAYATTRDGRIAILDGPNVVGTLPAGHRPIGLAVNSETGQVYVAGFGSDTITIIERGNPPRLYLPLLQRAAHQFRH